MTPLNDHDILRIIGMAGEVERLEREAGAASSRQSHDNPPLRLVGEGALRRTHATSVRVSRWRIGLGAGAALAACLGLAWAFLASPPVSTPPVRGIQMAGVDPATIKAGARAITTDGLPCVVLAIYRDSSGTEQCVDVTTHILDHNRGLLGVDARELLAHSGAGEACMARPDRLLIVAVAGPVEKLPGTATEVQRLASCVTDSSAVCEEDLSSYERAARACLPNGLTVVADMLTL